MIRDFWVKNYLSIRDKQELSFVTKGPSSELVTEVADGVFSTHPLSDADECQRRVVDTVYKPMQAEEV